MNAKRWLIIGRQARSRKNYLETVLFFNFVINLSDTGEHPLLLAPLFYSVNSRFPICEGTYIWDSSFRNLWQLYYLMSSYTHWNYGLIRIWEAGTGYLRQYLLKSNNDSRFRLPSHSNYHAFFIRISQSDNGVKSRRRDRKICNNAYPLLLLSRSFYNIS